MEDFQWCKTRLFGIRPGIAALAIFFLYAADVLADASVPEALAPWQAWALHGQEARFCPEVAGRHAPEFCAWPEELKLEIQDGRQEGLSFSQTWEVYRQSAVPLPGSRAHWPRQVMVDGKEHPVVASGDAPVVWLSPGRHAVNGRISWRERPRTLDVPESVALVVLLDGHQPVLPLERREGALTLGRSGDGKDGDPGREGDSIDVQVYRKLIDGIPARLVTRVRLKVSGKAREASVPDILPPHFVPVRLDSPWTARLDPEGRLQVQAMPGQATVEIEARLSEALSRVEPKLSAARAQETWSYEADPALRVTVIAPDENGRVLAVDPRQSGVPEDWRHWPAFALGEGARLVVEERSRGQNEGESQRLALQREMWLDFSGDGFFARDRIEGRMRQGWRFDVARPYTLERADSLAPPPRASNPSGGGEWLAAALLVTQGADETLSGVEWRRGAVTLNAGVRLAAGVSGRIPVTGWRQSFDRVDTTLHLPPGYRLIAAPGADGVSENVWVEGWTILDLFLAAFFALLAWRLLGAAGGLAAAIYLTLAMHESFAPLQSFAAVLVLALLCRALPEGRLRTSFLRAERLALLGLLLIAAVFVPMQIRYALYPQLEESRLAGFALPGAAPRPEPAPAPLADFRQNVENMESAEMLKEAAPMSRAQAAPMPAKKAKLASSLYRQRYSQSTVTQTGGGEPAWELGQRYRLHWSGPVTETQEMRLLVSPPWATRLLRVLMVVLLGYLVARLIRVAFPGAAAPPWAGRRALPFSAAPASTASATFLPAACLVALLAAGAAFPPSAAAQHTDAFPPADLLEELKTRLLEPPACAPRCIDLAEARIDAGEHLLRLDLTAHVEAPASLALPVPGENLDLFAVSIDGKSRPALRVRDIAYLALPRGVHRVRLEYAASGDAVSLGFPALPSRVESGGSHWRIEGISENRLLSGTLNFSRVSTEKAGGASPAAPAQAFPPFVRVRRDIDLDLDWSARTQVTRIAPAEGGFTFPVPLLAGEHVTTPEIRTEDGHALAVFSARAATAAWQSRLDKAQSLELVAPPLSDRAEVWRIAVGASWHLDWSGVPMTLSGTDTEQAVFEFYPLPGEKLVLRATQPLKTEGEIRAIDRVRLESRIGQHAVDHALEFGLRASQGGEHLLTLPDGLEVLDARRDGAKLNLHARENRLSLPVSPGTQTYRIELRRQRDIGWRESSPAIDLGLAAANIDFSVALGEQRWILAASGPAVGPAVLYWGEVAVALLLAFLLARSGVSSLGYRSCFLLVLGFSTFSWMTLLVIALWLVVIDWRVRSEACASWPPLRFDAMQTGIAALTLLMLERLIDTVPEGLLGAPGMGIRGYGSRDGHLNWFADRGDALLPTVEVFSLPIWIYRLLMLAWSLWLALILIHWLRRGLGAWLKNGYWKKIAWRRGSR